VRNCTKRKHEYRIHEPLSNGQWLNLYFKKHCNSTGIQVWTVGVCISNSIKHANKWFDTKGEYQRKYSSQTGKCGLEGLTKALKYILEFRKNMKEKEEIHVGWHDNKRKNAYKYLLRYNFFLDLEDEIYFARNMNYWERTGAV
jgi:hypothetical protein